MSVSPSVSLTTMRLPKSIVSTALAALCLVGVSACSSGADTPAPSQSTEISPTQRLAAAKTRADVASSFHLRLTSADVPDGADGIISAEGVGQHPPAFKGTFKVRLRGIEADAEVISLNGEVYAKLPLIPGMNKIDPKTFGLPDPAILFSTDKGLTTLLTATSNPTKGEPVRLGSEVLSTISGTVPGASVVDLLGIGDRNGTFAATYGLTDDEQLRQVVLKGPFFGADTTATYTLVLDKYGEPVTIEKP